MAHSKPKLAKMKLINQYTRTKGNLMKQEEYTRFLETYSKENFGLRLSFLRERKGVSARRMSLELGQNKNYINGIEVGNHFPTMQAFFEICYYLNI